MRNTIICRQRPRTRQSWNARSKIGQPRPQIDMRRDLSRMHPATPVNKGAHTAAVIPPLQIGQKAIGASLLPSDPPSESPRRPGNGHLLRIEKNLVPKATANIRRLDPHISDRHIQHCRQLLRYWHGSLGGTPDIKCSRSLSRASDHWPRFECVDDDPAVHHVDLDSFQPGLCRSSKRRACHGMISGHPVQGNIVFIFQVKLWRAVSHRCIDIRNRFHSLITRLNKLQRVIRNLLIIGNNHGNNITCRAVDFPNHRRFRDLDHVTAIFILQTQRTGDIPHLISIEISL